jgi:type I restriction enzyme S subunit
MELNEVCELIVDCEHKTAPTQETGYPSIRTPNIGRGRFILDGVNRVSEETYQLWTRRAVPQPGDLIMAREAPVGNVAMIPSGLQPCLGQRTLLIRPDRTKVEPAFLNYFLNGPHVQGLIHAKTNGATVAHLNMKDVRTMTLPALPPLPVQQRIAGILSAYDELIENSQRRIRILETMARTLYREWFVHFRFPGHEKLPRVASPLGEIPEGWEVRKLGEILDLNYGKALKKEDRCSGEFPVFGSSGIVGTHNASLVTGPGIIIGRKGNVGSVFWCNEDFFVIDTAFFVTSSLPLRFLLYVLPTLNFINSDAAVPGLSRNQAYTLEILVPPPALLKTFCMLADTFEQQATLLQRQIQNLRRTRDLLLPRLLSGQLTINREKP